MKKMLPVLVLGTLILAGFGAIAEPEDNYETRENLETISLSEPTLKENEENKYTTIELKESTSHLMKTGEPILPVINKKYTFPLGAKIKNVGVTFSGITKQVLTKKIMPAPAPIPLLANENMEVEKVEEKKAVYTSDKLYPAKQYRYSLHAGLEGKEHVIILNLQCFPIQYMPDENTIYSADTMNIEVTCELPRNLVAFPDKYDMVIIAP
ncbi:MAG: peptidase C25, partial [Thermoplasmatales archaeon]|nr:peptidase C25 [Thermoplasmatales archaeon]